MLARVVVVLRIVARRADAHMNSLRGRSACANFKGSPILPKRYSMAAAVAVIVRGEYPLEIPLHPASPGPFGGILSEVSRCIPARKVAPFRQIPGPGAPCAQSDCSLSGCRATARTSFLSLPYAPCPCTYYLSFIPMICPTPGVWRPVAAPRGHRLARTPLFGKYIHVVIRMYHTCFVSASIITSV